MLNIAATCSATCVLGPGRRAVAWVQGCPFRCSGCVAPEWIPEVPAERLTPVQLAARLLVDPNVDGLTFSGGEPMAQAAGLAEFKLNAPACSRYFEERESPALGSVGVVGASSSGGSDGAGSAGVSVGGVSVESGGGVAVAVARMSSTVTRAPLVLRTAVSSGFGSTMFPVGDVAGVRPSTTPEKKKRSNSAPSG